MIYVKCDYICSQKSNDMIEELQDELKELETLTEEEASMKFNCDSKQEYKELLLNEIEVLKSKESRDLSGERYGYDYY